MSAAWEVRSLLREGLGKGCHAHRLPAGTPGERTEIFVQATETSKTAALLFPRLQIALAVIAALRPAWRAVAIGFVLARRALPAAGALDQRGGPAVGDQRSRPV
jgi:hypothetical protein